MSTKNFEYSSHEIDYILESLAANVAEQTIADKANSVYHKGETVRTADSVNYVAGIKKCEPGASGRNWPAGILAEFFQINHAISSIPAMADLTPNDARIDSRVNYPDSPSNWPSGYTEYFSARYTGYIYASIDGEYTFFSSSDDGSKVWIDGDLIISSNAIQSVKEKSGNKQLTRGFHEVRVEYFNNTGASTIILSWTPPGKTKEVIPDSAFRSPVLAVAQELPAYETIFGKLDFKKGDEGRSVYSPAAYLTDLLQIMDDQFDHSNPVNESFDKRRGDIKNVLLDYENTFTVIPYLDIVNEVLEKRVGTDPYETLKNSKFPVNLPFDLQNERIKMHLQYLGVTAEQVYKLFAVSHSAAIIAREFLGLSDDEYKVILGTDGGNLLEKFGNPANLWDLENLDAFLDATRISALQLRELLFQNLDLGELGEETVDGQTYRLQQNFFIHNGLAGYAKLDDREENLTWSVSDTKIPRAWYDRVHRIIRLSNKTGFSLTAIDTVLQQCCGNRLDENAIIKIAVIKNLMAKYDLPVDDVCGLFSDLMTVGHGNEEEPSDLFDRLFNAKYAQFSKQYIRGSEPRPMQYTGTEFAELTFSGDILGVDNKNYRKRIHCALGINEKDLTLIVKKFRLKEISPELWNDPANQLKTLSVLYRLKKLVDVLDTTYEEIFHVFDVLQKDPLIRAYDNFDTFIHFPVTEPNAYKIITGTDVSALMWLVQTFCRLLQWMQENDITGLELKKIATGDYTEKIQLDDTVPVDPNQKTEEEIALQEKITVLDNFYNQYKPFFFEKDLFVSGVFDTRAARIVYKAVLESPGLVSTADKRILFFHEEQAEQAAYRAIDRFDAITRDDFLGLNIEEKVADKIYKNLVWKGYMDTNGFLDEDFFSSATPGTFEIDTDFSSHKQAVFDLIADLQEEFVDAALFPSDLKKFELDENEANELFDNLVFNRYIDETGNLTETSLFKDKANIERFVINANLGAYSAIGNYAEKVYHAISEQIKRFETSRIRLDKEIFEGLPFNETQIADLVENLRFNEYIEEEEDQFSDNKKILDLQVKDFNLALQFYPHRGAILNAVKDEIARYRNQYFTVKKDLFLEIGENIIADWCFRAVEPVFLQNGRLSDEHIQYFKDVKNASQFDVWLSFDKNDNAIVFNTIRTIVHQFETYKFTYKPLEDLNFNAGEIAELVQLLKEEGFINDQNKIPPHKVDYFLNIDNAIVFNVEAFEDYNKEIFFMLHNIAKQIDTAKTTVIESVRGLARAQDQHLYIYLQDAFGMDADSIRVVSRHIFKDTSNIMEEWLLPVIAAVDKDGKVAAEPENARFNTAFKRVRQFALLVSKLKLSQEEIQIAFRDQNLAEKFPENIVIPTGISSIDALLETPEGVYIFKGNRYWLYDPHTYELIEKDDKTDRTLSEISELLKNTTKIDAAFIDTNQNDVLIAGGMYLFREKNGKIWKVKEDLEWGKVDSSFDDLECIDAALADKDGNVFLFSGRQYVRYSTPNYDHVDDGYPKAIAESWKNENVATALSKIFPDGIDGAFHGNDGNTYFFKDTKYFCPGKMSTPMDISGKWGHIENNLTKTGTVDAAYEDGSDYFIFSGDQVFGYKDCLENDGVLVNDGFPKKIDSHFTNIPSHFQQGIQAAFKGTDNNIYIFREGKFTGFTPGSNTYTVRDVTDSTHGWGRINNTLAAGGAVNAAFTGLDGKTYLFCGTQYYRYSYDDYSLADPGYPRLVADDWSNLVTIDAAFVMDGKTYIFGKDANDKAKYIRYSTNDYTKPDDDYPKDQNDNWWNFPFALTGKELDVPGFEKIDAVFNTMDGKTYMFSGQYFIYFDSMHRWWSEPVKFADQWDSVPFSSIDAAFTGKDGGTYLFSGTQYIRFANSDFSRIDTGYPRGIAGAWGNVSNNIAETGIVDAAVAVKSHVEEEREVNGAIVTDENEYLHTYLFSGDQYVRYVGTTYAYIEPGYPKSIAKDLKNEPRFKNMTADIQSVQAAYADERNVYLFSDSTCHVISEEESKKYDDITLPQADGMFIEDGAVIGVENNTWYRFSSLEAKSVSKSPRCPQWHVDVPAAFKSRVTAVLNAVDGNTYIFRRNGVFDLKLENTVSIKEQFGNVRNNIQHSGVIDAAFTGRDGKTYLFSGDQFVVYEGDTFNGTETEEAPKLISQQWGGLKEIGIAYVLDGVTWLFETADDDGNFRYLRYSSDDYATPDEGYPKATGINFWQIPIQYTREGFDSIDAVIVEDETMFFIYRDKYLEYNTRENYWSYPKDLESQWRGAPCSCCPGCDSGLQDISTAFTAPDGTIYFFKDEYYTGFKNNVFSAWTEIKDHWGIVPNILKDKVDAAVALQGKTFLFSGDKYIRYTGADYRIIDDDYPKTITGNLRLEENFKNLPEEFEALVNDLANRKQSVIIDSVIANSSNVYIRVKNAEAGAQSPWFAVSCQLTRDYDIGILGNIKNKLFDEGIIDAAFVNGDKTYMFAGRQYIRYTGDRYKYIDAGYPKSIAANLALETDLGQVPELFHKGLDAAFKGKDNNLYLFKDLKYYNSGNASAGAVDIKGKWGIIRNNFTASDATKTIDAAFVGHQGKLYVFKGNQYIRYSDPQLGYIDQEYPKPIENNWGNLPADFESVIDGAFTFEGNTYFVKGDKFVKYSNNDYKTIDAIYPRDFADRWNDVVDYFLHDIKIIARFKKLQDNYSSDYTLVDVLSQTGGGVKMPYGMVAGIFDFDVEEVKWLKRHTSYLDKNNPYESRFNLEHIIRIFDALTLSGKMSAGISNLFYHIWEKQYGDTPNLREAADALYTLLGNSGCRTGSLDVLMEEIHDKLNILKRDALVPYIIRNDFEIRDPRDLYEKLLIDIQMGSCGKTSRIKEAISAVQLFFHRYFVNLEAVDLKGGQDENRREVLRERWKWMRNYRVWEANRKVFLYPENYIRPELRDTKTPAFKTLEEELLQGEITFDTAQRSYKKYIDDYTEVSRLKIAGGYSYPVPGTNNERIKLVLFGRTKTDPRRYYYRMAEFIQGGGASTIWDPWLEVSVQIDSDRVYPVYAFDKVFVFWPIMEVKNEDASSSQISFKDDGKNGYNATSTARSRYIIKIYFSFYNLNKDWLASQVLKDKGQMEISISEFSPVSNVKLYVESSDGMAVGTSGTRQDHENIVVNCTYTCDGLEKNRAFSLTPELYTENATKPNFSNTGHTLINTLLDESPQIPEGAVVMLNSSEKSSEGPWFSFDHKGGSFLCKPAAASLEGDAWPNRLSTNADGHPQWDHIDAAFHYDGVSWYFNNETGKYVKSGDLAVEKSIAADFGSQLIPSTIIGKTDAVLYDGTKTYFFIGDQYIRHTDYDVMDDGFPKPLGGNTDSLPQWDKVDAAFKGTDGKKYYFRNSTGKFVSSDNPVERNIGEVWGLAKNKFNDSTDPDPVLTAFSVGDKTYVVKEGQFIRYTGNNYDSVDNGYPKQGNIVEILTDLGFDNIPSTYNGYIVDFIFVEDDVIHFSALQNTTRIYRKGDKSVSPNAWETVAKNIFPRTVIKTGDLHVSRKTDSDTILILHTGTHDDEFKFMPGTIKYDGIFLSPNGKVYVFSGNDYMEFNKQKITGQDIEWTPDGAIHEFWGKVAGNITKENAVDAAFVSGDKTFLFTGDEYIRYTGSAYDYIDIGYPQKIVSNTDNLPVWDSMDAAFHGKDNKDYFFDRSGQKYVTRDDLTTKKKIDDQFGFKMKTLVTKVDCAFIDNDKLFLTDDDRFYRFSWNTANSSWKIDGGYEKTFTLPGTATHKLDAAYSHGDVVYLFSGDRYYKLAALQELDSLTGYNFIQGNWGNIPYELRSGFDAALKVDDRLFFFKNHTGGDKKAQYVKYDGLNDLTGTSAVPYEIFDSRYDIIRLTSSTAYKLNQQLFSGGIHALLRLSTQETDELPAFTDTGASAPTVIKAHTGKVSQLPVSSHLDFNSANGIYYWEMFFHAPFLIAQSLNAAQKFEDAKEWYEFIFDPTEASAYWKFLPFLAVDIDAIVRVVEDLLEKIHAQEPDLTLPSFHPLSTRLRELDTVFEGASELDEADYDRLKLLPNSNELTSFETGLHTACGNSITDEGKGLFQSLDEVVQIIKRIPARYDLLLNNTAQVQTYLDDPFDPHAIASLRRIAYRRAIVMAYVDNLIDWGDMLFTQYTVESINEARMLYILAYDLLGKKPENAGNKILSDALKYAEIEDKGAEETSEGTYDFLFDVGIGGGNDDARDDKSLTFAGTIHDTVANPYFYIPENSAILDYWDRVEDRLLKIRNCLNIMGISQPLPLFQPPIDPMALVNAVAGGGGLAAALAGLSAPVPHYRFNFMLNKARELANKLNQFGGDLLSAIEKKDSEELSLLQNKHELSILQLTRKIKEAQLKESQENLKNLEAMKRSAEMQKSTYQSWQKMLPQEESQIRLMTAVMILNYLTPILKLAAGIANIIPDIKVGSPFSMGATTGGSTVGAALGFIAESVDSIGQGLSVGGEIAGIHAQFLRSVNDWKLQENMAANEIEQLGYQIDGAKYAIKSAQLDIRSTDKEIENNESMTTFMKEKFSNIQLYRWMSGKLSGMFFQTYQLAHQMAKAAERSFVFERGIKSGEVNFISGAYWDSARKGLLSGEQLGLDLDRMENAYIETDARGFEITKMVSLVEIDPLAFLQLKEKGVCQFQLTEAQYDYDFQGHYNRQIKTVSLVLDAGKGVTVNATLTQLNHKTVIEPDAKAVKYLLNPRDAMPETIRCDWRQGQQIVLSHVGDYDENNGMFELRMDDERYLPFEGTGAVSSWRLQLNGKKGSFNIDNLKDVEIKIKYTADQGGESFAAAVKGMLKPYPAAILVNMAEQYPNEWYAFVHNDTSQLEIDITRDMFPNMNGSKLNALFAVYQYNEHGKASLKLNEEIDLKHNKLLPEPGLSVGSKGETWTFKPKGNKRALENMVLAISYKANVE